MFGEYWMMKKVANSMLLMLLDDEDDNSNCLWMLYIQHILQQFHQHQTFSQPINQQQHRFLTLAS